MKFIKKIMIGIIGIVLAVLYAYNTWSVSIYDTNIDSSTYEYVGEIKGNDKVEQSFVCPNNGLKAIKIMLNNSNIENDAEYKWSLKESNKEIRSGEFKANEIDNNSQVMEFEFDLLEDSEGKEYQFEIEAKENDPEQGIIVKKTKADSDQENGFIINGEQEEQVLVLTQEIQYLNIETAIVFLGLYLYLIIFMTFLMKLFK